MVGNLFLNLFELSLFVTYLNLDFVIVGRVVYNITFALVYALG